MKRVFMVTVAIMILLWAMPLITAHASTGLVTRHFRTGLTKGEVVEDIIVDDEPLSADEIIVDEGFSEPELIEAEVLIEPNVSDEEIDLEDEDSEDYVIDLDTPTDIDEALIINDSIVDEHMEEEIEESQNETEVQESE